MIIWSLLLKLLMLLIHLPRFATLNTSNHLISHIQVIKVCIDILGDIVLRVLGYLIELSSKMLRITTFIHLVHLLWVDQVCLVWMIDTENLIDFFVCPVVTNGELLELNALLNVFDQLLVFFPDIQKIFKQKFHFFLEL